MSPNGLELCWFVCCKKKFVSFVHIHTEYNLENIFNHILKFGRSLTNFVIGIHINTPNELNSVLKTSFGIQTCCYHVQQVCIKFYSNATHQVVFLEWNIIATVITVNTFERA